MERLKCKACGCYSMMPMEVAVEEDGDVLGNDQESRFFTCHVCGDNWLSVKETAEGECQITFIHQMGMEPVLKRVAHMQTPVLLSDNTVEDWDYFLGEDEVLEEEWHEKLTDRRQILKSVCSN
ncbi:MAG TPA: hypothetical protein VFG50_12600 [Rhodothermales bacterium]|nr:hypothetical protein [Rhodothermales bacterium]